MPTPSFPRSQAVHDPRRKAPSLRTLLPRLGLLLLALPTVAPMPFAGAPVVAQPVDVQEVPSPRVEDPREVLRTMVGRWTVDIEVWIAADQPPMVSTIEADMAMDHGNRFLVERATGHFLGAPSTSMTLFGFDDHHQRFDLTSVTSFSGATLRSVGHLDEATGHLVFRGEVDDARGRRATRSVYSRQAEGFVLTVYEVRDGSDIRVLRSTYRPKSP